MVVDGTGFSEGLEADCAGVGAIGDIAHVLGKRAEGLDACGAGAVGEIGDRLEGGPCDGGGVSDRGQCGRHDVVVDRFGGGDDDVIQVVEFK